MRVEFTVNEHYARVIKCRTCGVPTRLSALKGMAPYWGPQCGFCRSVRTDINKLYPS